MNRAKKATYRLLFLGLGGNYQRKVGDEPFQLREATLYLIDLSKLCHCHKIRQDIFRN